MREIALDTETTGLSAEKGHRIIEIGCVEMYGRVKTGKSFQVYINPERDVPEDATRIHGITTAFLKDKPVFSAIVDDFIAFIADAPLVIHNASFDMGFINFEMKRANKGLIDPARIIDTLIIARKKFPGTGNSLDALCKRFSVDRSHRHYHGALLDSELLADVYLHLTGGRQGSIEFSNNSNAEADSQKQFKAPERKFREARNFSASAEEVVAHNEFISKIKDSIWSKINSLKDPA